MSQPVGYQYKSRIPNLSDDASIVEALMVYHYGVDNYTTQPIPNDSIEGNFRTLNDRIDVVEEGLDLVTTSYIERISTSSNPNIIIAQTISTTPLSIRAIPLQTSPLIEFQNSSSAGIGSVTTAGNMNLQGYMTVGTTTQSSTTGVNVVIGNSSHKGIVVKAQSSQSANLQEWQNNSNTVLAAVKSNGAISLYGNQTLNDFILRNIYASTSEPTGGNDGDVWLVYA